MAEFKRGLNPIASEKIFQELNNPLDEMPNGTTGLPPLDAARQNDKVKADKQKELDEANKRADEAKKSSIIDSATGCYNRNFWENFVKHEFNPNRGDEASLIICDINGLKEINDNRELGGHAAGDALIKNTVIFLKENFIRKGDFIIRYGGDEFIIVCSHIGDKEKFVQKIEQKFNPINQQEKKVNFAFGIAHFEKDIDIDGLTFFSKENDKTDPKDKKTTFNRADKLMYIKKAEQKFK